MADFYQKYMKSDNGYEAVQQLNKTHWVLLHFTVGTKTVQILSIQ